MSLAVGVDVAKEVHWAEIKVAGTGRMLANHAVDNTPQAIAALIRDDTQRRVWQLLAEPLAGHG